MADDEDDSKQSSKKKASPFKRLFSFARSEESDRPNRPAQDWVGATADFDVGLEDMLSGDSANVPDHLHIVSLKALRKGLGEFEWQRRDERIRNISESLIRRHLPEGANYQRFGEDAFVLAFPKQTDEQAGALTLTIADEMGYRLIGEQFHNSKDVRIGMARADTQLLVADGALDAGAMELALQSVVPVDTDFSQARPDLDEDDGDDDVTAAVEPEADADKPEFELPKNDVIDDREDDAPGMNLGDLGGLQKRKPGVDPDWKRMQREKAGLQATMTNVTPDKPSDDGPQWAADEASREPDAAGADWVGMGAVAGASPIAVGLPSDLFAVVHPTWSATSGRIDIHVLAPAVRRGDTIAAGESVLGRSPSLQALAVADRVMVDAAARLLGGANRAPGAVIVPVHWETMNEARFPTLNPAFGRIDDTVRKSKLLVELIRVPESAPKDRLRAAIQRLKTMSRGVLVRDSLGCGRHSMLRSAGAAAVGVDLDDERMYHDALPLVLADEMENRGDVPGYLWGIRRKGDLLLAVEGGLQFVAGPALKPASEHPSKVVLMPKEKMIAALAKHRRTPGNDGDDIRSTQGVD